MLGDVASTKRTEVQRGPLNTSWNEWIFTESRQRLAILSRVVNMLVYFEPAAMCTLQTDLILAPLPAKKQLWGAADEAEWKIESNGGLEQQTSYGLAANGNLVKLDGGQLHCSDTVLRYQPLGTVTAPNSMNGWEEWCSGMDEFGGLIMLVASFVE
ncbi:hypothetical protein GQ53DRAFT_357882 [Thozetella sp. PMI_491]|nr:hypothetical protein GQ53DRAFT_357882 [Thozetella sp. PMI_491]